VREATGRAPIINVRDLALAAGHLVALPVAWLVPERHWVRIGRWLGTTSTWLPMNRHILQRIREAARREPELGDPRGLLIEFRARTWEQRFQYLREWHPRGWRPQLRLLGEDHVRRALDAGRGAILWVASQAGATLAVKKAFHRAGYGLHHLSIPAHGLSTTRFGTVVLRPIRIHPEVRVLRERIEMARGDELRALRLLERILRENGLVSISCVPRGRRQVRLGIAGGQVPVPSGAPSLALRSGAALLPVFLVRRGAGQLDVLVEAPLEPPPSCPQRAAVEALLGQYVERLRLHVRRDPAAWRPWGLLEFGPPTVNP
jgi:hypothetical protein